MEKLRTLLIDDEVQARKGLRTLLARDPEIDIIGECSNGQQAIAEVQRLTPDLLFLDVQMPHGNGFEVIAGLAPDHLPTIIFVTAFDQYALQAFEVSALDYLLKPFSDERFYQAVARAKEQHQQKQAASFGTQLQTLVAQYRAAHEEKRPAAQAAAASPVQRFFIKTEGEIRFVSVDEVDWLEADGYCTKLHTGNKVHLLRGHLGSLESRLDPNRFLRIHRSTIVNLSRVQALKDWFHGDCLVVLRDGTELRVSRTHRKRLESLLERFA